MSAEEPLGDQPTGPAPVPVGLELNAQQRTLVEALREIDQRLSEMYLGALAVLQQPFNSERYAQAAHTLRVMIDRLPTSLGLATKARDERQGDRLQKPERAFRNVLDNSSCFDGKGWSGTIDEPLARALVLLQEFFAWKEKHRPRRLDELTQILRRLDASGRRLPERLEVLAVDQLQVTRDYFVDVCHYRISVDETEYFAYLDAFERFILDRLRPRTFADFDAVDVILEEADRGD